MGTPPKRRLDSGKSSTDTKRTTPKGGRASGDHAAGDHPGTSSRYTPPSKDIHAPSPPWVTVLMFAFLGIGMLLIFLNYAGLLPGTADNANGWYMLGGLASILAGIITATQLR